MVVAFTASHIHNAVAEEMFSYVPPYTSLALQLCLLVLDSLSIMGLLCLIVVMAS